MMNSWKKVYKKGLLDHIESYKSNYHMITTTMVPRLAKEERGHNFLPLHFIKKGLKQPTICIIVSGRKRKDFNFR
jgi:hypothetical protein